MYQDTSSVYEYYTKLKDLWDEFEALVLAPCDSKKSRDYVNHMKREKLYQFLMGLKEPYLQARSQILMMYPLSSVNKAYSMIISDESQKSVAATAVNLGLQSNVVPENYESTALITTRSGDFQPTFQPNNFHTNNFQHTGIIKSQGETTMNSMNIVGRKVIVKKTIGNALVIHKALSIRRKGGHLHTTCWPMNQIRTILYNLRFFHICKTS